MKTFTVMARILLIGMLVFSTSAIMTGCSKKPNKEEASKLDDARAAAESAEKKLADLRQERMKLEQELQAKQAQLKAAEQERDSLQNKVK